MPHRGQESTDGTDGGDRDVPMAWLYAEYVSDELLRSGDLMPPTSFEYRAGRDALALTVFLSDPDSGTGGGLCGLDVVPWLDTWMSLTAYDAPWQDWVRERLAERVAAERRSGGVTPDLRLAQRAWRWLEETELLAPDLDAVAPPSLAASRRAEQEGPQVWTPAWQLGLPLGHLSMHLF